MTWSWSHTVEAYCNARRNVESRGRDWLMEVWAEWEASVEPDDAEPDEFAGEYFNEEMYADALRRAADMPEDILADDIWRRMEDQANCDNGGFNAWACPYGCGCHVVSFDDEAGD